jgi:hypothetical protein
LSGQSDSFTPADSKAKFRRANCKLKRQAKKNYKKDHVKYPEIIGFLDEKYGEPIMIEGFLDLDQWTARDTNNWGSANPDNYCVYTADNVYTEKSGDSYSMFIKSSNDKATGNDWFGNDIEKPVSSGWVRSNFIIRPGQVVSATMNTSESYKGSWFAFWLYKKKEPGDDRYREIDIFEKFQEGHNHDKYTISMHAGTLRDRNMMNYRYNLNYIDEKNVTFTCEIHENGFKVFIDGVHVFSSQEVELEGNYYLMFDDAPTRHGGKVELEEVMEQLPRRFEVKEFRVYNLPN